MLAELDPRPYQVALDQANGQPGAGEGNAGEGSSLAARRAGELRARPGAVQRTDHRQAAAGYTVCDRRPGQRGRLQADQAAITAAQAAIDSAKLNLTYTKITAPISGRIGLRQVDAGNMVHAADATGLAVITQLQPISVIFSIFRKISCRRFCKSCSSGASMRVEAYDRDQKQKLADGTLLTVDNQIDQTTGTSKLKAVFPNNDYALFPESVCECPAVARYQRGTS